MTTRALLPFLGLLAAPYLATAQVPDSPAPAPAPAPAQSGGGASSGDPTKGGSSFLGKDVPFFDPGSETLAWDGKAWNINNNRIFQARFEKYLNAPAEDATEDAAYRGILQAILDKLAPSRVSPSSLDEAYRLLPRASDYEIDAHLSDALADAVYSVWQAKREDRRLVAANGAIDEHIKKLEWNSQIASETRLGGSPPSNKQAAAIWKKEQDLKRDLVMQPYATRLVEARANMLANKTKREVSEIQTKLEFQALIVQLFLQRRFQHVLVGTRFYRNVFADGDTLLRVSDDVKNLFASGTGMPPTVGLLDSLANEAIRDAAEGVKAFDFLRERNEMESATKRLAEAFTIGEYLPLLRTLSREAKRDALAFQQKANQLLSALEVKDYALAEKLVNELAASAKDFDSSKAMAAIETARTVSSMHLAKAKTAAVSGDTATLETELKQATEIWPRNPELADVSRLIFSQADVQQRALMDLDQLLSQKNYRQISDEKVRFIAAAALYPERQEKLIEVLGDVGKIDAALIQANEISRRGDHAGAWEVVERTAQQFPDDSKLNQMRAELTTQAADFVRTLRRAEALEKDAQTGSSLAWYLKAESIYPPSDFAQAGVARLVKEIMPEAGPSAVISAP